MEIKVKVSVFTMYVIITVIILTISYNIVQTNSIITVLTGMLVTKLLIEIIKKIEDYSLIVDKILTVLILVTTIYIVIENKQNIILISAIYIIVIYILILIKKAQVHITKYTIEIKAHLFPVSITTGKKFRAKTIKEYLKLNKNEHY